MVFTKEVGAVKGLSCFQLFVSLACFSVFDSSACKSGGKNLKTELFYEDYVL